MTGLLNSTDALGEAQEAAKRAVELDESLAEAHSALAHTYTVQWNWEAAAREFRRALDLDPNFTTGNPCHYVEYLLATANGEEAIKEIERIRTAQPLATFLGVIMGWAYYGSRSYDLALRQHREILKDDPKFGLTHVMLGLDYSTKRLLVTELRSTIAQRSPPPAAEHVLRSMRWDTFMPRRVKNTAPGKFWVS